MGYNVEQFTVYGRAHVEKKAPKGHSELLILLSTKCMKES